MKNGIENGAFLVDVRTPEEFRDGNIAGSINIPLNKIQDEISQFMDKDQIIVFCRSGARSAQAKSILEHNGIKNITNGGGIDAVRKIMS